MYNVSMSGINFHANKTMLAKRGLKELENEKTALKKQLAEVDKRSEALDSAIREQGGNVSYADHYEELRYAFRAQSIRERLAKINEMMKNA